MIDNMEVKRKSKAVVIFQIIVALLYAFFAFFMIYTFIDSVVLVENPNTHSLGVAIFLIYIVIIFGGAGAITNLIVSFIGLMVCLVKKKKGFLVSKGQIAYFIVFCILPVLTVFTIGIITRLMV